MAIVISNEIHIRGGTKKLIALFLSFQGILTKEIRLLICVKHVPKDTSTENIAKFLEHLPPGILFFKQIPSRTVSWKPSGRFRKAILKNYSQGL